MMRTSLGVCTFSVLSQEVFMFIDRFGLFYWPELLVQKKYDSNLILVSLVSFMLTTYLTLTA